MLGKFILFLSRRDEVADSSWSRPGTNYIRALSACFFLGIWKEVRKENLVVNGVKLNFKILNNK